MSGIPGNEFETLARRYWAEWAEALRRTAPGMGPVPGAAPFAGMDPFAGAAPQARPVPGIEAWQESIDWWTRLAQGAGNAGSGSGSGIGVDDALGHFNRQAREWYGRMQEVAARFAGQDAGAGDIARAWKEALGAAGANPFPEMLRSMRGQGLQGLDQWMERATPWLDSLREAGQSWLRMPTFGHGREHQERLQQLALDLAEYQQAQGAYSALMAKAQQDAFAIFEDRLVGHEEPGRRLQSARALFDLWIDAAEEAYAAVALSPGFREAYGRLVNSQMRVRSGVQRMVEDACAQLGMPTRSELDGAHRRLAQLEREVRKLRDAAGRERGPAPGTGKPPGGAGGATKKAPAAARKKAARKVSVPAKAPAGATRARPGKGFGNAIAGAIPQAPEPVDARRAKKKATGKTRVKKGKR